MGRRITYLAVMPRSRKPKVISTGDLGFYQANARKLYECLGLTASQARIAIAQGRLKPTWVNGKEVGAATVHSLLELTKLALGVGSNGAAFTDAVLRIGGEVYRLVRGSYGPTNRQLALRYAYRWHRLALSGFTYDADPVSHAHLQTHAVAGSSVELALLREDYSGVAVGAMCAWARAGHTFEPLTDKNGTMWAAIRDHGRDMLGRKYSFVQIVSGGQLTAASVYSLSNL